MRCYGCLKEIGSKSQYCPKCKKNIFDNVDIKPLSFNKEEFYTFRAQNTDRMSISGVQDKISLKFSDSNILEPAKTDGRYILKPIPRSHDVASKLDDMPANEHISMQISKQIFKLNTAENCLVEFKDGELAYLTKRFDYQKIQGMSQKAEQEDFASVLGYTEELQDKNYKYESSYEDIAKGIKKYVSASIPATEEFYKRIILNYLISNGDAHLKNFSLIRYPDRNDYILSPNYDLLFTSYHLKDEPGITALELFSEYETTAYGAMGYYTLEDFEVFGKALDIPNKRLVKIFKDIMNIEPEVYELVSHSYLSDAAKEAYISSYEQRLKKSLLYYIDSYSFKKESILVNGLSL